MKKLFSFLEPRQALDLQQLQNRVRSDARSINPELTRMSQNSKIRAASEAPIDGIVQVINNRARPWKKASDQRVRLANSVINENKDVLSAALRLAALDIEGHNSGHDEDAAKIIPVMNYMLGTVMGKEAIDQPELMADYALDHGTGYLHVGWRTLRDNEQQTLTVDALLSILLQMRYTPEELSAQQESGNLQAMLDMEEEDLWNQLNGDTGKAALITKLQEYDAAMTKEEAGRVVSALKAREEAVYYRPYVRESRPYFEALQLGVDIVIPSATLYSVQRAPRVTRWHWYTQADVYDIATQEGWNEEALDALLARPGAWASNWSELNTPNWFGGTMGVNQAWNSEDAKDGGLYHIAETWHRMPTKSGASALYRTLHHGDIPKTPLLHEVSQDKHGVIPIVSFRRENRSNRVLTSDGITQNAWSPQNSLKRHIDAQDHATSLRSTPPMIVPPSRYAVMDEKDEGELPISPFAQIESRGGKGTFAFTEVPGPPLDSVRMQESIVERVHRDFGMYNAAVPTPVTQLYQRNIAARFMDTVQDAVKLLFQLCQQYMDPITGARVAGMATSLNATREEIQGQWSFKLSFDPSNLDITHLTKKMDLHAKMLQLDTSNVLKRSEFFRHIFAAADPVLAAKMIMDEGGAQDAAYQDEKTVITTHLAGLRVTGRLDNPQSRLKAHEEWASDMDNLAMIQGKMKPIAFQIMRVEALEFNIMQTTMNRTTGRTGEKAMDPWQEQGRLSVTLRSLLGFPKGTQMTDDPQQQQQQQQTEMEGTMIS